MNKGPLKALRNRLQDLSFKNNVESQEIQDLTIDGAVIPIFYQNCNTT